MIKCQNCGAEMPDNAKFCGKCGTAYIPNKNICKTCGAELLANAKFCGKCGTAFSGNLNINICKSCGAQMPANVKFCGKCGTPISSTNINQGTPYKADVNTSSVYQSTYKNAYQNTQNFTPPGKKSLTSKTAFWVVVIAAVIIIILIINNSGGSSKRQSDQPGVTVSPPPQNNVQRPGNEPPARIPCGFCQGTGWSGGKQCIFCMGTGYALTEFPPQTSSGNPYELTPFGEPSSGTPLSSRRCIVCDGKGFLVEYPFGSHSYNMEFCLQCGKRDYPHMHKRCEICNGSGIQIR